MALSSTPVYPTGRGTPWMGHQSIVVYNILYLTFFIVLLFIVSIKIGIKLLTEKVAHF